MADRLGVVTHLWPGPGRYRPEHVNALARAVRKHLTIPHAFICLYEPKDGDEASRYARLFDESVVTVVPMPRQARAVGHIASPEGGRFPSSYRRLWLFSEQAPYTLGVGRVLQLDIDCIPVRSLDRYVEDDVDFIGWRPRSAWGTLGRLAGGTWYLRLGSRLDVWEIFIDDPVDAIATAKQYGFRGSDQAWLSYMLSRSRSWPEPNGLYQAQDMNIRPRHQRAPEWPLPPDARLVHFNGPKAKPWTVPHWSWVRLNWDQTPGALA